MAESQIVIVVNRDILREFRAECIRRETTPTRELARLLCQQLHTWEQEPRRTPQDVKEPL